MVRRPEAFYRGGHELRFEFFGNLSMGKAKTGEGGAIAMTIPRSADPSRP